MATYTKETALYDVNSISTDIGTAQDAADGAQEYAEQLNQTTLDMIDGISKVLNGDEDVEGAVAQLETLKDNLATLSDTYNVSWRELNSFIKFKDENDQPNLVLGNESSTWNVVITNTDLVFRNGTDPVAYMNADGLYVNNYLSFGNFQFYQRANGHFTLKFIGGNS